MKRTLSEKSLYVPNKREMLFGIFCWVMFLFGFSQILPLFFDVNTYDGAYWAELTYLLGSFLLTVIVFFQFLRRSQMLVFPMEIFKAVLIGFGLYLLLCFVVEWIIVDITLFRLFLLEESTYLSNPNQESIQILTDYNPWPMYIGTILLAPVTEECLVRGMIFGPLCRKKPALAYLVTTLLFAGLHVFPYIGDIGVINTVLLLLVYIPSGLVLGWTYQRTRTIFAPIALHCMMNLYATIMTLI